MDYHIFQGDSDQRVPRELHADRLVEALTARGIPCTYDVIPGGTHAPLSGVYLERFFAYVSGTADRFAPMQ